MDITEFCAFLEKMDKEEFNRKFNSLIHDPDFSLVVSGAGNDAEISSVIAQLQDLGFTINPSYENILKTTLAITAKVYKEHYRP